MGLYESILKPALFQLDAERAHELGLKALKSGLLKAQRFEHPSLVQELLGATFPNPLGLAAGFDKNAVALNAWPRMGFGFAEIGTVTLRGQPGNERPRLFRLPQDQALINRMGFNNDGAQAIAARLGAAKSAIPFGVNIGKSKVAPIGDAAKDYAESYTFLRNFGSYVAINVSSPNTPGLRDLQDRDQLLKIVEALKAIDATRPLLIKVSPDLEFSALDEVIQVAHETKLAGLIATNTTLGREGLAGARGQSGGLSGRPLRNLAQQLMRHLYASCDKSLLLIGVGGIMNGDDLYDRIAAGAHLCQTYTGWIYGGPRMVPCALARLTELMQERGHPTLAELRGSAGD